MLILCEKEKKKVIQSMTLELGNLRNISLLPIKNMGGKDTWPSGEEAI